MKTGVLVGVCVAVILFLAWPSYGASTNFYECNGNIYINCMQPFTRQSFGGGLQYIKDIVRTGSLATYHAETKRGFYEISSTDQKTSRGLYFNPVQALTTATIAGIGAGLFVGALPRLSHRLPKSQRRST